MAAQPSPFCQARPLAPAPAQRKKYKAARHSEAWVRKFALKCVTRQWGMRSEKLLCACEWVLRCGNAQWRCAASSCSACARTCNGVGAQCVCVWPRDCECVVSTGFQAKNAVAEPTSIPEQVSPANVRTLKYLHNKHGTSATSSIPSCSSNSTRNFRA